LQAPIIMHEGEKRDGGRGSPIVCTSDGPDGAPLEHPHTKKAAGGEGLEENCAIYIQPSGGSSHPPPCKPSSRPHDACPHSGPHHQQAQVRPPTPAAHVRRRKASVPSSDGEEEEEDCGEHGISRLHLRPTETSHSSGHRRGAPRQRKAFGSTDTLGCGRVWGPAVDATWAPGEDEVSSGSARWGSPDTTSSTSSREGSGGSLLLDAESMWGCGGLGDSYNPNDGSDFAFLSLPMEVPILTGPGWIAQKPLPNEWFAPTLPSAVHQGTVEPLRPASEDEAS